MLSDQQLDIILKRFLSEIRCRFLGSALKQGRENQCIFWSEVGCRFFKREQQVHTLIPQIFGECLPRKFALKQEKVVGVRSENCKQAGGLKLPKPTIQIQDMKEISVDKVIICGLCPSFIGLR